MNIFWHICVARSLAKCYGQSLERWQHQYPEVNPIQSLAGTVWSCEISPLVFPGRRIHASLKAWLAGSNQPRGLQDKRKNIAKGTTDPRVEFISQVLTQIWIKFNLQNVQQAPNSKSQPNISISTKL